MHMNSGVSATTLEKVSGAAKLAAPAPKFKRRKKRARYSDSREKSMPMRGGR